MIHYFYCKRRKLYRNDLKKAKQQTRLLFFYTYCNSSCLIVNDELQLNQEELSITFVFCHQNTRTFYYAIFSVWMQIMSISLLAISDRIALFHHLNIWIEILPFYVWVSWDILTPPPPHPHFWKYFASNKEIILCTYITQPLSLTC